MLTPAPFDPSLPKGWPRRVRPDDGVGEELLLPARHVAKWSPARSRVHVNHFRLRRYRRAWQLALQSYPVTKYD
jgi:hypothetical protein